MIVFLIVFAVVSKKDMSIFVKIATVTVVFTFVIVIFDFSVGIYGISKGGYTFRMYRDNTNDDDAHPIPSKTAEILMFGGAYNNLLGILGGGFYAHNVSLPIYRNTKHP